MVFENPTCRHSALYHTTVKGAHILLQYAASTYPHYEPTISQLARYSKLQWLTSCLSRWQGRCRSARDKCKVHLHRPPLCGRTKQAEGHRTHKCVYEKNSDSTITSKNRTHDVITNTTKSPATVTSITHVSPYMSDAGWKVNNELG